MTIIVANTDITNTFDYWRTRTNEMATAFRDKAVTVESNTAVGNAAISGNFTANSYIVGNNATSDFIKINYPLQKQQNTATFLAATGDWVYIPIQQSNGSSGGTGSVIVDSFSVDQFLGAEYVIHIKDTGTTATQISKILITHNTTNAYYTEYGDLSSGSSLGYYVANVDSRNVRLWLVPVTTVTYKLQRNTL